MIEYLSKREVFNRKGSNISLDIEVYPNYFLICFDYFDGGKFYFELRGNQLISDLSLNKTQLKWMLENNTIFSFNGNGYDIIVLMCVLKNDITISEVYDISQSIIQDDGKYEVLKKYNVRTYEFSFNHIDVMEVAPSKVGLKTYAGRIHAPYMQDLPYRFDTVLDQEQMDNVLAYCWNDTNNTMLLAKSLEKQIALRCEMSFKYQMDLRSKSDAQIAEAVIGRQLYWEYGIEVEKPKLKKYEEYSFKYKVPKNIKFKTKKMNDVLEVVRNVEFHLNNFKPVMPHAIKKLNICIGDTTYRIGMGGLHSTEKNMFVETDETFKLIDRDVTSYYPAIILNQRLYPDQLGESFLKVYKSIVDSRIEAKRNGDKSTADSLKVTINGSFGKFGNVYSILFSPELLIQTTVSGQLYLLMAIEALEEEGFSVISGNTDGFVTKVTNDKKDAFDAIMDQWEIDTGFNLEETVYTKYFASNVNNYIAVTEEGELKRKGWYSETGLNKNPSGSIVYDAVCQYVLNGTPLMETIQSCKDFKKFLYIRNVKGGCVDQNGDDVGKVVRWYYDHNEFCALKYKVNGDKVPKSDGARVFMDLTVDVPDTICYARYLHEAQSVVNEVTTNVEQLKLF